MARGRRKVNTDTMDAKIEQQKAVLEGKGEVRSGKRSTG